MNEKILYEERLTKNKTLLEDEAAGTVASDIANSDPKFKLAKPVTSLTLPELISYIQPIDAPQGYVFGLKDRDSTAITQPDYPATLADIQYDANHVATAQGIPASPVKPEDMIITRKLITTNMREVAISTTNEVEQDIISLFGSEFASIYGEYNRTGEVESSKIAKYFLDYGEWKLTQATNADFMTYLSGIASLKGTATIADYTEMSALFGILGELKESLFKSSDKSGRTWVICTPKIAAFFASTVGAVSNNKAIWYNNGRIDPDTHINPYVCTLGDMDIYQYNTYDDVTGGTGASSETTGEIYMGLSGGPGTASIYYTPYRKYIVKGGSDAYTGQSTVFYRIRDAWTTNPQDTFDEVSITSTTINPVPTNSSQYVMKADVIFTTNLLV